MDNHIESALSEVGWTSIEWYDRHKGCIWLVLARIGVNSAGRCGIHPSRSIRITDNSLDIPVLDHIGTTLLVIGTHPVVAAGLICIDDDLVPLTNVDEKNVCRVWYDRHEVGGNYCQGVTIDGKGERGLDGNIDDPEQV